MNPTPLLRPIPFLHPPKCLLLRHPFSTSPLKPADEETPPTRPAHPPLPSNLPRNATSRPPPNNNTNNNNSNDASLALANSLLQDNNIDRTRYKAVRDYDAQRAALTDVSKMSHARDLERRLPRGAKWAVGDVYAPHDLSVVEGRKWNLRKSPARDAFDVLGIDPLREYKNFAMMSEYTSSTGRIKPRRETGLRAVNQRKIAKAIRRAVGMGLLPSVHEHPEILEVKARARAARLENR